MYSSTTSASYISAPIAVSCSLPLDPDLQARSLHPLGTLQFNRPYGDLAFEKTKKTLSLPSSETNDALKLTALSQILETLSHPQKITLILDAGCFSEFVLNASNENEQVRVLASAALASITASRAGREFAIQADIVPRLSKLIANTEPSAQVRQNVLKMFLNMTSSAVGILHLLARGLFEILVEKIGSEKDLSCRAVTLEILSVALREPKVWQACMNAGAVTMVAQVLRKMLTDSSTLLATDTVLSSSTPTSTGVVIPTALKPLFATLSFLCKVVAHLATINREGKDACVRAEIVPLLVTLLSHPVTTLRLHSSLALQHLTNCELGKIAAIEAQAIGPLLEAVRDPEELVQCQAMQAIANLAEHPVAKVDERIQGAVEELKRMQEISPSEKVRHAAKLAVAQITWQP